MSAPPRSAVSTALAADRLGATSVASFALTAVAPLMVMGGLVTSGWAQIGVVGFPLAFAILSAVLVLFSIGYMAMAQRIRNAGAFYSYVSQGLGKPLGVAAAFVAMMAYNGLQFGLYGIFGGAFEGFLISKGVDGPQWWVWALIAWAVTALVGMTRVDINSKVLLTLLAAEVVIVVIYDFAFISQPAGSLSFAAFEPDSLFVPGAFAAVLVMVIASFIGFEAAPVFAEESRDSRRTIPMATYAALGVMFVLYTVTSWAMTVATGPGNIVAEAQKDPSGLMFGLAGERLNATFADIGAVLLITSAFAAMLSYHNTAARYTFSLAREGVLPRMLARTGARSGSPLGASLLQTVLGLIVILLYAINGWDPILQLFFYAGAVGGFGVLALLILTSLAVISYFWRRPSPDVSVLRWAIAPMLAVVTLGYIFFEVTRNFHVLLGVAPDNPLRWGVPGAFGVVALIGIILALVLKATKPPVYAAIGRGAEAAVGIGLGVEHDDVVDTDADVAHHSRVSS